MSPTLVPLAPASATRSMVPRSPCDQEPEFNPTTGALT